MKLFLTKCVNSLEYRTMLGKLLSCTIRRGMQKGLDAGIEHGKEGRKLADIVANNPTVEADYNSAYRAFRELDFPLLADLSSGKDSHIEDAMRLLQLEAEVAEKLGLANLQPSLEQLSVHRIRDNLVVGEAALSSSLNVARQRVKKIRENISIGQPVLADVFTSVATPLSSEVLLGSGPRHLVFFLVDGRLNWSVCTYVGEGETLFCASAVGLFPHCSRDGVENDSRGTWMNGI